MNMNNTIKVYLKYLKLKRKNRSEEEISKLLGKKTFEEFLKTPILEKNKFISYRFNKHYDDCGEYMIYDTIGELGIFIEEEVTLKHIHDYLREGRKDFPYVLKRWNFGGITVQEDDPEMVYLNIYC